MAIAAPLTGKSFGCINSSFLFPPKLRNHLAETKQSGDSTCLTLNKLVYCAPLLDYADEIIPLYAITAMTINAMNHNNILSRMFAGYSSG